MIERMPVVVGGITLVAGAALIAAPQLATRPLGLEGQETAMRLIGASDHVLVPGRLRGRPRWPFMVGRAALNLGVAAYLRAVDARGLSAAFVGLTAVDGATAVALRRRGA